MRLFSQGVPLLEGEAQVLAILKGGGGTKTSWVVLTRGLEV